MRGFLSTGKPASPLGKPLPYQIKYVGLSPAGRFHPESDRRKAHKPSARLVVSRQHTGREARFDSRHVHAYSRKKGPTYTERIYQTAI